MVSGRNRWSLIALSGIVGINASSAFATFHFMQIEQVIGGVNGDTSAQAIQLRMLSAGQNLLAGQGLLRVFDAAGGNPVTITSFPLPNPLSGGCRRVLIVSPNFQDQTSPPMVAGNTDYLMTNLIPPSYLAAGSLTFEDTFGTVLWRLSWGGASYTGSNLGSLTNDGDGNFGPPFAGPLPSASTQALTLTTCGNSTNNAAMYALTPGAAVFVSNDSVGNSFTVTGVTGACCDTSDGTCDDGVAQNACVSGSQVWTEGEDCAELNPPCTAASVPTASEWGLAAMALLVLTAGSLSLNRITGAQEVA